MKTRISFLFAALMTVSLPALAHHDGTDGHHCERHGQAATGMLFVDTDNDGTVSWEEAHDAFVKHFDEMDTDQDGVLSAEELKKCSMSGMHDMHAMAGKEGDACKHGMHDKGSKEFSAADKDHDGTLAKSESKKLKHIYKNFDAIDADHDGTVDRDEVHTYMHDHPQGK
jgi:Ca2+-binding EF-hand superfamily protein